VTHNFDEIVERRKTGSYKWSKYDPDVLPMFVADMDFKSPQPVINALLKRVEHGVFGYEWPSDELANIICERMRRQYQWHVTPQQVVFLPGLVSGLNLMCRAIGKPVDSAVLLTPAYPPFLSAPVNQGMTASTAQLREVRKGQMLSYEIDFDAFEAAIKPNTRLFIQCHPHNPTGHEYTSEELLRLGDICLRHNVVICSDEIHCDLMMDGNRHTPMAALSPEIANQTITLMAPSKTFNIPGLGCSFAIIQNLELQAAVEKAMSGIIPHVNALGLAAAAAAYTQADSWLVELRKYLTGNRDTLVDYVTENMPGINTTVPEATYLAWLDCSQAGIQGSPYDFFLTKARVAVNDGPTFGPGGENFVRFNYGCPRSQMMQALDQMKTALDHIKRG
jgi:cystathionine beta-lyase